MAERATRGFQELGAHLARIVGTNGVLTVLNRAIAVSSTKLAWLEEARVSSPESTTIYVALRTTLERQSPEAIIDAFGLVLSTFVCLLGKLIGDSLVWRLIQEVWPSIFPVAAKEPS